MYQGQLKVVKEIIDMEEPTITFVDDATNHFGELEPTKLPDPNDKDAPKLKRLAPRRPKQQPEDPPKKTDAAE